MRGNRGFTLLELLIALALLVILASALYGTYFSVIRAREKAGARVEERRELSTTLGTLHRELVSAYYGQTNKNLQFVVEDRDSFGKPTSMLQLTTVAPPRVDPAPASDLMVVRYLVKEKEGVLTLTRESKDLYLDVKSVPYPVIDVVEGFLVECYDGSQWVKSWDTTLNHAIPKRIRVTVTLKGGEVFSTLAVPRLSK